MEKKTEEHLLGLLHSIQAEIKEVKTEILDHPMQPIMPDQIFLSFKGSEIYLFLKAFVDSGGAPHDNYKSFFEKVVPQLANKTQRGFSPQSFCKFSDKVDPAAKETVKRFLERMRRNIDSYD